MPIEGWILFGICAAGLIAETVLMVIGCGPFRSSGGLPVPKQTPPAPLPYKHIGHVVVPVTIIKPGMYPPKR